MNRLVSAIDVLSLVASSGSLLLLAQGKMRSLARNTRVILGILLAMFVFHDLGNVLEWTGLTAAFDVYGDYLRILIPVIWAAFVYTILQERADRELRASKERFRSLVESTSDWVWESTPSGSYTYSNPRVKEILGYEPEEVTGRRSVEFMIDGEAERARNVMGELAGEGKPLWNEIHAMVHRNGHLVYIETGAVPFFDERGKVAGYRGVSRDVTARQGAAEVLRQAKENLEQQNRELVKIDRIKDGLIRDVSHELKTPVAKLSMQIELLTQVLRGLEIREVADPILEVMKSSLKRQERIIGHILDLSRLEAGGHTYERGPCLLHEILGRVVEDYRFDAEANGVRMETSLEPISLESDEEMLWHVFSNLLGNAIKFTRGAREPLVRIRLEKNVDRVLVTVADNGVGLEKEEIERVFERFYKAIPSIEGTGVGLSIARMIVEDLGGDIRLESPGRGRGATVLVRF